MFLHIFCFESFNVRIQNVLYSTHHIKFYNFVLAEFKDPFLGVTPKL